MAYASRTEVPVDKTRMEIERTLTRYGAKSFAYFGSDERAVIVFEASDRRIRFDLPLPPLGKGGSDQHRRARWRGLLLCIKAKLEAVEAGIETFEEAFLAHVMMPDGATVGEHAIHRIAAAYKGEAMPSLLPPPKKEPAHD